jgi:hypothetical protein
VVWNQSYNPTSNPNSSDEVVWNQSYDPTHTTSSEGLGLDVGL